MSKLPAIQFYIGDWLKDPQLSMCTPATRGIWFDFICAIHEIGHGGQVTGTVEQFCRICRCTVAEMNVALAELKETKTADISDRNGKFTVTCRRMSRECHITEQARIRKQNQRLRQKGGLSPPSGHAKVTPYSSSSSSGNSDTDVSGGTPPPKPPDVIWDLGIGMLRKAGDEEKAARSFLGKLCKDYGSQTVAQAVAACSAAQAVDPKAYLQAVLGKGGKFNGATQRQSGAKGVDESAANKGRELDAAKSI